MIDVCLLGCGGSMPMPERSLSATLINYKGRKILIDCGEGTQVSMKMVAWGFKSIDIICITHTHGDHIIGLPGLLSTIGNSGRTEPLTIIGPEGITRVVNGLRVVAEYLPYEVNIIEAPSKVELNVSKGGIHVAENNEHRKIHSSEIILNAIDVDHSSPCKGYSFYFKRERKFNVEKAMANNIPKSLWSKLQRQEEITFEGKTYTGDMVLGDERRGVKISLITDSRPMDSMVEFIAESDLFICEGTYGKDEDIDKATKNKHMIFRESATLAKEGRVKELILTHFSPIMGEPAQFIDNAKEIFDNSVIGEDRMVRTLTYMD
ncbi:MULTISPECIES: ribonuclease Z [unclassified Clostridium]|uniref:ribonuclease Z n=1 Tax=unclassified Clostridium TaxID=2614128 RepID=UPI003217237C